MVQSPILCRMFRCFRRRERRTAADQWPTHQRRSLRQGILWLSVRELGRRERIVGPADRPEQRFAIVRENLRLLFSTRYRHIARSLIRRPERFARHADEHLVDSDALASVARYAIPMGQMP